MISQYNKNKETLRLLTGGACNIVCYGPLEFYFSGLKKSFESDDIKVFDVTESFNKSKDIDIEMIPSVFICFSPQNAYHFSKYCEEREIPFVYVVRDWPKTNQQAANFRSFVSKNLNCKDVVFYNSHHCNSWGFGGTNSSMVEPCVSQKITSDENIFVKPQATKEELLNAMASGLVVVTSANNPSAQQLIVQNQNGLLVKSEQEKELVLEAIKKSQIDTKTMSKNAIQSASRECFSLKEFTSGWKKILEN